MNRCMSAVLLMASSFGLATSALAGEIAADVEPAVPSVSLSVSLSTGASVPAATYNVTVTNTGSSNTLNNPRFVGSTTVWRCTEFDASVPPKCVNAVLVDAKAVFRTFAAQDDKISCGSINADRTSIECTLPPLPPLAPANSKQFEVTFDSPAAGEWIEFKWQAVFDLGTPPGNSNGEIGSTEILLDPIDLGSVTSHVPGNVDVSFFTGYGVATGQDPWVTIVKVPAGSIQTTASVDEDFNFDCPVGTECTTSDVSIPDLQFSVGEGKFLNVTLRRDESTIPRGAKISDAVIYYKKDGAPNYQIVPSCSSGPLPQPGQPCEELDLRKAYPRKSSRRDPVQPDFLGDWEFVIKALDNGRFGANF